MATLAETLIVSAIMSTVLTTGLTALEAVDTQVQQVAFGYELEAAADCADRVFTLRGIPADEAARLMLTDADPELRDDLLTCVEPITGVSGDMLRQDPTAIYDMLKQDL